MLLVTWLCVMSLAYGGGGVTKSSGISEFWTDDYKVFEQIYGKTSDRDLYGENLPRPNLGKLKKPEASEKKERLIDNEDFSDFEKYSFGDRYAKIFAKQILNEDEKTTKPPKAFNFISYSDFKPISQYSDPETYNYLKHLEHLNTEEKIKFPKGIGGFKPFLNKVEKDPEEQAYKSIQDILDAHEANKGRGSNDDDERDDQIQYLTYPSKERKKSSRKKPGSRYSKPPCWTGRCRKRASSSIRVRTRPYVRKITQNRWSSG